MLEQNQGLEDSVRLSNMDEFIEIRHQIHRHPELAFQEHKTSALVVEQLKRFGYQVTTGLGKTGVVGQLKRGNAKGTIGIRADMDALPILEETDAPWASQHHGLMHACGHDGHTAILLAAAKAIAESQVWQGTVNLIFQPAEEGGGGAVKMIEDGLFSKFPCDQVFGLHNIPGYPQGQLLFRVGPMMASYDDVNIVFEGVGGHGAMPHMTNDPIVAASATVMALQTIVSRNIDPLKSAVVTVAQFHAGTANNIIPPKAEIKISVRALDSQVRQQLKERILAVATHQAESFGVKAHVDMQEGYVVLVNDEAATLKALATAKLHFPAEQIINPGPLIMGSEDFAFMSQEVPGCYFFIGNGEKGGKGGCMVHNPSYDFHDDNIAVAAKFWLKLVEDNLTAS